MRIKTEYYDFIIAYEHRNREINSICLLKNDLEKRGYSVLVYYIEDKTITHGDTQYECEVLTLPYGYNDYRIYIATGERITYHKLVNLQWEQLFNRIEESNPDSYRIPRGLFKQYGMHISWGEKNKSRLINIANVDERHIRICGHMGLDFLKAPLNRIYMDRRDVLIKFGIDPNSKVRLFISSYKSAFIEGEALEYQVSMFGEWRRKQHDILLASFLLAIDWYYRAAQARPTEIFIYRPHPGETSMWSDEIRAKINGMAECLPNFRIIEDLTVQQWILVSDWICIGGISTAVSEVYYAGRSCCILYPYKLPDEVEMSLFDGATVVKTEDELADSLDVEHAFPIDADVIESYYYSAQDSSFERVADAMIDVYKNPEFHIPTKEICSAQKKSSMEHWKGHRFIWRLRPVRKTRFFIGRYENSPRLFRDYYLEQTVNDEGSNKEIMSKEEIQMLTDQIMERIYDE